MRYSSVIVAAAIGAVSAQDCMTTYNSCIAAGTPEVVCQCALYSCSGEDSARLRDYCSTATASLAPVTGTIAQPSGAPQVNAPSGSVPLGGTCGADEQCSAGAQCFGSTAGTIRTCGSFNAKCSSDSQCATNTCQNGICSGFLASSVSSEAPQPTYACNPAHQYPPGQVCATVSGSLALVTTTGTPTPTPQPTYACNPAHQYPPGQVCATISGTLSLITTTGTAPYMAPTTTVTTPVGPTGTGGYTPHTTAGGNGTAPITPYAGSASMVGASLSGLAAVVAGVAAWAL